MIIKIEYATNIGSRTANDDSLFIRTENKITTVSDDGDCRAGVIYANADADKLITAAVFDGMGGKTLGGYSSKFCCDKLSEIENPGCEDVINLDRQFKKTGMSDYGTTISLVNIVVDENSTVRLKAISAGDSPIIGFCDEDACLLNELDNEAFQKLKKEGHESEYSGGLNGSNRLLNYVGEDRPLIVHEYECSLNSGSKLLICSDGVLQNSNSEITSIVSYSNCPAKDIVKAAVMAAKDRSDNVTAVVITFLQDEAEDFILETNDYEKTESYRIVKKSKKSYIKKLLRRDKDEY